MKKALLLIGFLLWLTPNISSAQDVMESDDVIVKPNEIKVDLLTSILLKRPTVAYERILMPDLGVGANLGVGLGEGDEFGSDAKFHSSVFARWYFGGSSRSQNRAGAGFFMGANTALSVINGTVSTQTDNGVSISKANQTAWGLGLELGWKYVTRNNWVGESGFRLGRYLAVPANSSETVYGTYFITIGKRF